MSGVRLSVIVPTIGRPSLAGTLAALAPQLEPEDEVIVVADGSQPMARMAAIFSDRQFLPVVYAETERTGCFGNHQRDIGMQLARGTHLLFIDDDDAHEPGALAAIRNSVDDEPAAGHVFRARWGPGHHANGVTLWKDQVVREGNIGTPMVVLPNRPYGTTWAEHDRRTILSDYGFLSDALGELPRVCWHEQVIAVVRPRA